MQTPEQKLDTSTLKAVIGLGNPGPKYTKTRHNIGFRVVDELAKRWNLSWRSVDTMEIALGKLLLIKPQTFMNASGRVAPYLLKKGIKPENIIVVHDELEKQFGHISTRFGGSARGHNGLRSIIGALGADFWRLRIGIGRPENKADVGSYVLRTFRPEEERELDIFLAKAADIIDQSANIFE